MIVNSKDLLDNNGNFSAFRLEGASILGDEFSLVSDTSLSFSDGVLASAKFSIAFSFLLSHFRDFLFNDGDFGSDFYDFRLVECSSFSFGSGFVLGDFSEVVCDFLSECGNLFLDFVDFLSVVLDEDFDSSQILLVGFDGGVDSSDGSVDGSDDLSLSFDLFDDDCDFVFDFHKVAVVLLNQLVEGSQFLLEFCNLLIDDFLLVDCVFGVDVDFVVFVDFFSLFLLDFGEFAVFGGEFGGDGSEFLILGGDV